jgi:hypothetical protein
MAEKQNQLNFWMNGKHWALGNTASFNTLGIKKQKLLLKNCLFHKCVYMYSCTTYLRKGNVMFHPVKPHFIGTECLLVQVALATSTTMKNQIMKVKIYFIEKKKGVVYLYRFFETNFCVCF